MYVASGVRSRASVCIKFERERENILLREDPLVDGSHVTRGAKRSSRTAGGPQPAARWLETGRTQHGAVYDRTYDQKVVTTLARWRILRTEAVNDRSSAVVVRLYWRSVAQCRTGGISVSSCFGKAKVRA